MLILQTQICIQRLEEKFPKSPRVDALQGLLLERESPLKAKEFYQSRLAEDENNVVRILLLILSSSSICSWSDEPIMLLQAAPTPETIKWARADTIDDEPLI